MIKNFKLFITTICFEINNIIKAMFYYIKKCCRDIILNLLLLDLIHFVAFVKKMN